MASPLDRTLTTTDHRRDALGLTYIYAVNSRRAGGISLGVNLNPNNACNWRCIYCQVPNLRVGAAPPLDLELLERELSGAIDRVLDGEFLTTHAPIDAQKLSDIAISGNGEPTTSDVFDRVVEIIRDQLARRHLVSKLKVVLITNGSQIQKPHVLAGLETLGQMGGEVWYKLDAVSPERRRLINNTTQSQAQVAHNLGLAAARCATRIQSCMLSLDGHPPDLAEQTAYVEFLRGVLASGTALVDVTLYGPDRESHQPEAARITKVEAAWLEGFAEHISQLGLPVITHG